MQGPNSEGRVRMKMDWLFGVLMSRTMHVNMGMMLSIMRMSVSVDARGKCLLQTPQPNSNQQNPNNTFAIR